MFARRHSDGLSSTLEQSNFQRADPPCTSRENWVRTTTSFKLAFEIFSIRKKPLISDHLDKLAFSLNKKYTDDVIFSHEDTLIGCPLDANRCQNHQVSSVHQLHLLLSTPYITRNLGGDEHDLFVVNGYFLSYVPGMHVVVFTGSSSVAPALASTFICCSILQYLSLIHI